MEQEVLIVTNNPTVSKDFGKCQMVEGSFEDVLLKVRDLVYEGHELISHPIGASMRMLFSPYRSVLLGPRTPQIKEVYALIIENSIDTFRRSTANRKVDIVNADDYARIDLELLKCAIVEHSIIQREKYQEVQ
ncbi:GrdX family protein [Gudongella sp. DL1XJH-153]|uniref:GrdX family protein n=1 Tax=Gudongella sp. DL1XJH-153 TaxID=3409804 RepID=UPI003BB6D54C